MYNWSWRWVGYVIEIKILGLSTSNQRCHEIRLGAKKSLPLIWISVNVDAFRLQFDFFKRENRQTTEIQSFRYLSVSHFPTEIFLNCSISVCLECQLLTIKSDIRFKRDHPFLAFKLEVIYSIRTLHDVTWGDLQVCSSAPRLDHFCFGHR